QIIPNEGFSVLCALVPRAIRAVRKQQKERSANRQGSGAHGKLRFNSSQHPLTHSGNSQSSSRFLLRTEPSVPNPELFSPAKCPAAVLADRPLAAAYRRSSV